MRANGWRGVTRARKITTFVESAILQATAWRRREGHPVHDTVHHSDAGSQ
jgi:putative transposase